MNYQIFQDNENSSWMSEQISVSSIENSAYVISQSFIINAWLLCNGNDWGFLIYGMYASLTQGVALHFYHLFSMASLSRPATQTLREWQEESVNSSQENRTNAYVSAFHIFILMTWHSPYSFLSLQANISKNESGARNTSFACLRTLRTEEITHKSCVSASQCLIFTFFIPVILLDLLGQWEGMYYFVLLTSSLIFCQFCVKHF